MRSARQLSTMPDSLDLLITSLGKVASNPGEPRYRRVPLNNANFKAKVVDAPGGLDLLKAVGYEREGDALVLRAHDDTVLILALSALEDARRSGSYMDAKSEQLLMQALDESKSEWDEVEKARRARAAAKVPKEPEEGAAGNTLLCIHLGERSDRSRCVWRRFESWNTLEDLYAFVESITPFEMNKSAELWDITLATHNKLDHSDIGRTLQVLSLWPTGHVKVQPIVTAH